MLKEQASLIRRRAEEEEEKRLYEEHLRKIEGEKLEAKKREMDERKKQQQIEYENQLQEAKKKQEEDAHDEFKRRITSVIETHHKNHHYEEIPEIWSPSKMFPVAPSNPLPEFKGLNINDDATPLGAQARPAPIVPQPSGSNTSIQHKSGGRNKITFSTPKEPAIEAIRAAADVFRSNTPQWTETSFLGPRFPSLVKNAEDDVLTTEQLIPRVAGKKKIEILRQVCEDQLRSITDLEGSIHEVLYQTRDTQPPCSLLSNENVVWASQCPQLLPGDSQQKMKIMREILELMEHRKQEDMDTLRWLQQQPRVAIREVVNEQTRNDDNENADDDDNDVRASERLAGKRKVNYRKLHTQGKADDWFVGEY